jgi:hypothetical protein
MQVIKQGSWRTKCNPRCKMCTHGKHSVIFNVPTNLVAVQPTKDLAEIWSRIANNTRPNTQGYPWTHPTFYPSRLRGHCVNELWHCHRKEVRAHNAEILNLTRVQRIFTTYAGAIGCSNQFFSRSSVNARNSQAKLTLLTAS